MFQAVWHCRQRASASSAARLVFFFFSSPPHFSLSSTFLLEGALRSKTYFPKVDGSANIPRGRHLFRPSRPFWDPVVTILDFAGVAGGERVPPTFLGWVFLPKKLGLSFIENWSFQSKTRTDLRYCEAIEVKHLLRLG